MNALQKYNSNHKEAQRAIQAFLRDIDNENTRIAKKKAIQEYFEFKAKSPFKEMFRIERLQDYRDYLIELGRSPNTIHHRFSILKSLCKYLVLHGAIDKNLVEIVKLPKNNQIKRTNAIDPALLKDMIKLIENDIDNIASYSFYISVLFLFKYGMRIQEVASLKWKMIQMGSDNKPYIRFMGKGSKYREVGLTDQFMGLLLDYHAFVFEKTGIKLRESDYIIQMSWNKLKRIQTGPFDTSSFNKKLKRYAKKVGIENISSHSGRSTVVTELLNREIPIRDIANIVGHSDIRTTLGYDRGQEDKGRNIIELLDY